MAYMGSIYGMFRYISQVCAQRVNHVKTHNVNKIKTQRVNHVKTHNLLFFNYKTAMLDAGWG